jgi:hypothetical protein
MVKVRKSRRKGGFLGLSSMANKAVVPLALVALNQSRSKGKSGGGGAAGYVSNIAGSSTIGQLERTFSGNQNGNALVLTNGKSVGGTRRKGKGKGRRGGQWSQILNQAIVPAGILALQQSYRRRGSKGGKRTKRRHH